MRTTCSDASIATYAVSPTDLNRHLREIISELSGLIYVPIRLRQALGFAERGCTPHPACFLGRCPKRVWAAAHKARPIWRRTCVNRIGTLIRS